MKKPNQKNFLLELAEANKDIIYTGDKTLARLNWLKPWEKNPKFSEKKDLQRLKKQIEELGVYKPLIIYLEKNHAVILGGNQRYKVLKELQKKYAKKKINKYEYVWVSVVNAENDYDKLKYALSDNEQVGKYDVEKLKEVLEPQIKQGNLFADYNFNLTEDQSIQKLAEDLAITKEELKFKTIKKELKELGINDETLKALETMTNFNKLKEKLEDVNIKGKITGQKFPLLFWVEDEETYKQLQQIYDTGYKDNYNTELLIQQIETITGAKLPTTADYLEEIKNTLKELTQRQKDEEELQASTKQKQKTQKEIQKWEQEIIRIANLYFPGLINPNYKQYEV